MRRGFPATRIHLLATSGHSWAVSGPKRPARMLITSLRSQGVARCLLKLYNRIHRHTYHCHHHSGSRRPLCETVLHDYCRDISVRVNCQILSPCVLLSAIYSFTDVLLHACNIATGPVYVSFDHSCVIISIFSVRNATSIPKVKLQWI